MSSGRLFQATGPAITKKRFSCSTDKLAMPKTTNDKIRTMRETTDSNASQMVCPSTPHSIAQNETPGTIADKTRWHVFHDIVAGCGFIRDIVTRLRDPIDWIFSRFGQKRLQLIIIIIAIVT